MKTSLNVVVFTILSCGLVRSYRVHNNDNSVKAVQSYPEEYSEYDSSDDDTADKWDHGKSYGPYEGLSPQSDDYNGKENRRHPSKEIHYDYDHYEPEYGLPEFHRERFPGRFGDYPTHARSKGHKVEYWPYSRHWRDWSDGGWAFPGPDADPFTNTRFPNPTTSPPTTVPPMADQKRIQDCIRKCPGTPEYNPVCGTNAVTYSNPGRLECAKFCGVDVELQRYSPCNSITTVPPTRAPFETKPTNPTTARPGEPSNPTTVGPIFTTPGCPDGSDDCYEIDIRTRNFNLDDERDRDVFVFATK